MINKKKYKKELKVFERIQKEFPKEFNDLEILKLSLFDDEIDFSYSITSRSDGKTTGAIKILIHLAVECDYHTLLILPHDFMQRTMMAETLETINKYTDFDGNDFMIKNNKFAQELIYKGKTTFGFSNLDDAMELKHNKEFLSKFRLFWFDEFIRFSNDYLIDEIPRYQTILETMDKDFQSKYPVKGYFSGNPLNFDSPFFAEYDMYENLANHKLNTIKQYTATIDDNGKPFTVKYFLEIRKNENVNNMKSRKRFRDRNGSNSGEFQFNTWRLSKVVSTKPFKQIIIKLSDDKYIYCFYQAGKIILSVKSYCKGEADYTLDLAMQTEHTRYIEPRFINEKYERDFRNDLYFFENSFSKVALINQMNATHIAFKKLIDTSNEQEYTEEFADLVNSLKMRQELERLYSSTLLNQNDISAISEKQINVTYL